MGPIWDFNGSPATRTISNLETLRDGITKTLSFADNPNDSSGTKPFFKMMHFALLRERWTKHRNGSWMMH